MTLPIMRASFGNGSSSSPIASGSSGSSSLPSGYDWTQVAGGNYSAVDPNNSQDTTTYDPATGQYYDTGPKGMSAAPASSAAAAQQNLNAKQAANPGTTGSASTPSPLTPSYLSQLFPNGIPQMATAQAATAQAPVSTAQSYTAAPSESTNGIVSSIMSSLAPQFQQQDQGLTEALANAGIVGGSTTGAVGALGQQQQQQAMGEIAPYIMQGITDTNQTNQFNAGQEQAGSEFNASAQNQGGQFNAGAANAQNDYNASAQNAGQQYNISNLLNSGMYDSTLGANQEDTLANLQNQDYLAQLGLQGNLITAGAGAQTGSYEPVYEQATPTNLSGLGSALGSYSSKPSSPSSSSGSVYGSNADPYGS